MTVKEHYDNHLGNFYAWMAGDFATKQKEFISFLDTHGISPAVSSVALDLGAGHGIQATALAQRGFTVRAVDFNAQLLNELRANIGGLSVEVIDGDIRSVCQFAEPQPEVIVCWGDTLTHLESLNEVQMLLRDACEVLAPGGKLILSFRDYSQPLTGAQRFIPVKSDNDRILTCVLDYEETFITVTDLLHVRDQHGWQQKVSAYRKVRIPNGYVQDELLRRGLCITADTRDKGLIVIVATK